MERSRRFFYVRRTFDLLPDPMLVLDPHGKVVEANPAAKTAFFRTHGQLLGATLRDVGASAVHVERFEQVFGRVIREGETYEGVIAIETTQGKRDWEVRFVPDLGEHAEVTSVFVIARDVTAAMQRASELKARSDELTRLGDALCHDLRSPLVTIRSFLGFLVVDMREKDEARISADIGSIQNATDRMSALITLVFECTRPRRLRPQ